MSARHLRAVPVDARRPRSRHLWIVCGGDRLVEASWGRPGERRRSLFVDRAAPVLWPVVERDRDGTVATWSVRLAGLWICWERRAR